MRNVFTCLLLVVLCTAAQPAWAKKPEGGNSHRSNAQGNSEKNHPGNPAKNNDAGEHAPAVGALIGAGITALEARNLALGQNLFGLQPLPPGIRKNLARGKPLPPGIAKKMVPSGLLGRLPVHPGYEWRMLGTDLVLVHLAQGLVADVLSDVFK